MRYLSETLAVVVLYKQSIKEAKTLVSLSRAMPKDSFLEILVYDNSPMPQKLPKNSFEQFRLSYVHDPNNPGVSKAYNFGAKEAKKRKKNWLLILDQDTTFSKNIFSAYGEGIENNAEVSLFAPILQIENGQILSPCKFSNYKGSHLKSVGYGRQEFGGKSVVNSGILIKVNAFFTVGGYNEKVKLDFSDHQFIDRYKKIYKEFVVVQSIGEQSFSVFDDDLSKELIRFGYYCEGAKAFGRLSPIDTLNLYYHLTLKTLKKTIRRKSGGFLLIFLRTMFR